MQLLYQYIVQDRASSNKILMEKHHPPQNNEAIERHNLVMLLQGES